MQARPLPHLEQARSVIMAAKLGRGCEIIREGDGVLVTLRIGYLDDAERIVVVLRQAGFKVDGHGTNAFLIHPRPVG